MTRTLGDYKHEKRFAWLPIKVAGRNIWLKKYERFYEWSKIEVIIFEKNYGRKVFIETWELIGEKVI